MQSAKSTTSAGAILQIGSHTDTEAVRSAAQGQSHVARESHRLFWNCAPEGLFSILVGDKFHFVFDDVNPTYQGLIGLRDTHLVGRPLSDCLPAQLAETLLVNCQQCVAAGKTIEYNDIVETAGTQRNWRTTLMPMKDPATRAVYMLIGKLEDLTPNREARKAEGESRRLLQRIVDASPDVIYVFDVTTGQYTFLSSRFREALGYSPDLLQSIDIKTFPELIHPDDLLTARQHLARVQALRDGAVADVEYRCRTGDGTYRWFRSKETVFSRTKDGRVEKIVGILSDIDRLKKARIAFTDMNARLAAILASISDCYLTIDAEGRFTDANSAAAEWFRMNRDEIVGMRCEDIFAGPVVPAVVRQAIDDGRAVNAEMPSQLHPGRWINLHAYPTGGGVNIFFSDITKRKHAEEAAARSKAVLNAAIDALSAHIVILDADGTIVASNKSWRRFAGNRWPKGKVTGPGSSYLALYGGEQGSVGNPEIVSGVSAILVGRRNTMRHIYQLGFGGKGRWHRLVAARFVHEGKAFAVLATEDVTDVNEAKKALGELSERIITLQAEERQRIAQELHDSTAQHLAAIGLNAMSLRARSSSDTETRELWEDVEESLDKAARELRAFTYLLHPARLEGDGLSAVLQRYVEGFAARTGIVATLNLRHGIDDLPMPLRVSMLRIVQEALTHVHRHASATRVSVKQKVLGNRLHMVISDNGQVGKRHLTGMAHDPHGVDIPGMRERLRRFDGSLDIKTVSHGTTVHVSVPFKGSSVMAHLPNGRSSRRRTRSG